MNSEPWRLLPYSVESATLQLAAGEAMLAGLEQPAPRPALRWYRMNQPALILGTSQKLHKFDLEACKAADVKLYRRSSGGTAVLSEPDQIMQDIVLPKGHPLHTSDVTMSYKWLGEVWVAVFEKSGAQAALISVEEARSDRKNLDDLTKLSCYGGFSPYEVLVNGRKVAGLAQVRRRYGALLQTGIYTHWHPRRLADLLAVSPAERDSLTARLQARVAGLADVLPDGLASTADEDEELLFTRIMQHFAAVLYEKHGITLADARWSSSDLAARAQAAARFAPLDMIS